MSLRVVSANLFYPRGGSAHVTRALAHGLAEQGFEVMLLAGSRTDLGDDADAVSFYGGAVHVVDFTPALTSADPLRYEGPPGTAPIHPSFEDRPGAPDAVFAKLDDLEFARQVGAWARELERAGAAEADVLHLHHLTPLNEAAARVAPGVPIVGQLHGTELLMLERIAEGPPTGWPHAERWAARLRRWAHECSCLLVASAARDRAAGLLDLPAERLVALNGGVDLECFAPRRIDRPAFWRRVLSEEPRGWLPGQPPGSARYDADTVVAATRGATLLYVGRFTAVKRLDRLIEAYASVRGSADARACLVLVGGHPGEWEGEHPAELARRLGAEDVFLAGWYPHHELPEFFAGSDGLVLSSDREQFGQVLLEAMACGLPPLACSSIGPASIIDDGRSGWLVERSVEALADGLRALIADPAERERRGRIARAVAAERYGWPAVAARLGSVLTRVARGRRAPALEG